eukprot:7808075-Prorocentrum_lima.AAC.1
MTSSLVGSEMCIRDRPCWPFPAMDVTDVMRNNATGRVWMQPASGEVAVSYTHLTLPTICSV